MSGLGEPYLCEVCGMVCVKGWTDEEKRAEADVYFPGITPDEEATVCDPCYRTVMAWARGEGLVRWP